MKKEGKVLIRCLALLMAVCLSACAWTDVASIPEGDPQDVVTITKSRDIIVEVQKKKGAYFREQVCSSLYQRITECIDREYADKYKPVKAKLPDRDALYVRVLITRYDDGVFYARSTFSDSVRMRINAVVTIAEKQTNKTLAEFSVATEYDCFPYSRLQKIGELEPEFAKEVLEGISERLLVQTPVE